MKFILWTATASNSMKYPSWLQHGTAGHLPIKVIFQTIVFLKWYLPLKKGRVGKFQDRQDILENKHQINGRQTSTEL